MVNIDGMYLVMSVRHLEISTRRSYLGWQCLLVTLSRAIRKDTIEEQGSHYLSIFLVHISLSDNT
jgi:hypothetical protein